ncbi:MAG TPA: AI-2E family transporter [Pyrinomonadaceae bacterium]|jgi:predicted PurR-regulated permease PerM
MAVNDKKEGQREVAENAAVAASVATWSQTRAILRVIFIILAVVAAIWILYRLEGVLLLVVLSIFFAYLVAPLVEFVRRPFKLRQRERTMPRGVAIGIVYLVLFGSFGLVLYLLLPRLGNQVKQFGTQFPNYLTSAKALSQRLDRLYGSLELPSAVRETVTTNVLHTIEAVGSYMTEGLSNILLTSLPYIPWLVLIPILAFFLLKDADSFRRSALQMLPRGRWRWRGDEFFQDVNSTLAAYIRAQLIACLLIGLICFLGFWLIGLPYALMLGILAGFLEFIPLVGPLVVAIMATLISSFYSVKQAVLVLLFLAVLRIVQDYVLYPRIVGQGIHLHPLAVILAILCGAELAGVAGIFLAIPVIAILTVSYRHWLEHRGSEGLVADLLKPVEEAAATGNAVATGNAAAAAVEAQESAAYALAEEEHPTHDSTPEQMARVRPDLTTGELKLDKLD